MEFIDSVTYFVYLFYLNWNNRWANRQQKTDLFHVRLL